MHGSSELSTQTSGGHSGMGHSSSKHLFITISPPVGGGGPAIFQTNFKGKATMPVVNCGPTEMVIHRGTAIGHLET